MSGKLTKAREYEKKSAPLLRPEDRPLYHLTPLVGWMNDPNGFSYYDGQYHLFYQYYPYDVKWGPMHWGHAVSKDLLRWKYEPCALAPDTEYDKDGVYSGSALQLPDGRHLLMYTGVRKEAEKDETRTEYQTQCIAVGDGLEYHKLNDNPVIDSKDVPDGWSIHDFRDPKLWRKKDGGYGCVIGSMTDDGNGAVLLYRSEDAFRWSFDRVLACNDNTLGRMWECPDYFELDGKKILLINPVELCSEGLGLSDGHASVCMTGILDSEGRFVREQVQAVDYGLDFYATQTMEAPDGRRIMIAWLQNWDAYMMREGARRWYGQMTIPRELSLKDGRLNQLPIRELEKCRCGRVYHHLALREEAALTGVSGRIMDMTVEVTPDGGEMYREFWIKLAGDGAHYSLLAYQPDTSIFRMDRSRSGLCGDFVHERKCFVRDRAGKIGLRILMDRFSIEVFINDGEQALSMYIDMPQTADEISFGVTGGSVMLEVEKYGLSFAE